MTHQPFRLVRFLLLVLLLAVLTGPVVGQDLASKVMPLIKEHQGKVGLVIRHLETGEQFAWRSDAVQPTASLIKLPVMVTAYRLADANKLDLKKMVQLKDVDKVPGSGVLTGHFSEGMSLSIRDAIRLMIRYSDNTATNLVAGEMGLPATTDMMTSLGFAQTRLHAFVYRGDTSIAKERSRLFGLGSTTAKETVDLLEMVHKGTVASAESCKAMLDHLKSCDDKSMIVSQLPRGTQVAHKSGAVNASRCNAGIVYGPKGPFAICVLTTGNKDQSWDDQNAAHQLIGRISRIAFDHFNPEWERGTGNESPELRLGNLGTRVEYLQRTLNARMTPSPGLGVDGDFGPATESVVRKFQEMNSLPVTGIADAELWKALGPIVEEQPVAAPDEINGETLPKAPLEPLDGPPFVSSDAWTIVDAETGAAIGQQAADVPSHFASTTKMMTAWLVIRLAETQPGILDEVLTMSARADETRGSTSDIRAGEQLTIREALYGLMLPSGNDMSVALAEHFGQRLAAVSVDASGATPTAATSAASVPMDPLQLFVDAMNAEAKRLGMSNSHYTNPHGLTNAAHLSTAADLAVLARAVLSSPLYRSYVSTRQHGATVEGPGGYRRNVIWKNTNELLGIEGYDGIKTGTTDQAGACLVSTGERNGKRLIVVVLGSAASEARYTDSRNLYRWAWKTLGM
jgi:D-alanyl-D-alanine carboxypeptidase (penicillin-binding protein 5/6)